MPDQAANNSPTDPKATSAIMRDRKDGKFRMSDNSSTEDTIRIATDGERGRFVQLLRQVEDEFWRVTKERDDLKRKLENQHDR